jgi:ectoine hydroxylase-related dioxygenase (phytanoyl-CoA dioxygenase family)
MNRPDAVSRYRLSAAELERFRTRGHLGPFDCEAPGIAELPARVLAARFPADREPRAPGALSTVSESRINVTDPHRDIRPVREVIEHPSIVDRVAQLLGADELRYFQSRYRVKLRGVDDTVEWHQDVGPRNGGCYPDGRPIPTVTIWMSIDGAAKADGSVQVLPGTHRQLLGDWRQGYAAGIEKSGHLRHLDLSAAVALETAPRQFHAFHSWLVHISGPNTSDRPRTGLVVRFVRPEDAIDPSIEYWACRAGASRPA